MNWRAFDLNLLVVFDAVMQDRSVTRAGRRIGLSQPAMSHALNRLRDFLKDELFVRTPTGMRPTPRAERLAALLRQALRQLQRALQPETFVPATADRRFSLAINNYAAVVVAPSLVTAVSTAAPSVHLDLRPSGTLDIIECLDRGDLDLAIGSLDRFGERFACTPLLEDEFVNGHASPPSGWPRRALRQGARPPDAPRSSNRGEHRLPRRLAQRAGPDAADCAPGTLSFRQGDSEPIGSGCDAESANRTGVCANRPTPDPRATCEITRGPHHDAVAPKARQPSCPPLVAR
jgi:DNA-binding transcriptional LysR family regulator